MGVGGDDGAEAILGGLVAAIGVGVVDLHQPLIGGLDLGGGGVAVKAKRFSDPLHIWARYARANARGPAPERTIKMHENDRRAFETLGFKTSAKSDEIKRAYKALVKIHHPDANGGDKTSEERLRSIIAAYTHLKQKGFVGV